MALHLLLTTLRFVSTTPAPSDAPRNTLPEVRLISSIIFSCVFTVAGCLWVCVRPNIPSPRHSSLQILRSKLNIFFWVVICPDLVIYWAFRQWTEGNAIVRQYKQLGWTRTHGQFMIMGGFVLYVEGQPHQTLSPQKFTALLNQGAIALPSITEREIHSQGLQSPVLTGVVGIHVLWFIMQCSVRFSRGLFVTHLEFLTLALIAVNVLLYIIWWNKPHDIRQTVRVDLQYHIQGLTDLGGGRETDFLREKRIRKQSVKRFLPPQASSSTSGPAKTSFISKFFNFTYTTFVVWPVASFFQDIVDLSFAVDASSIRRGASGVPLFYCPEIVIVTLHFSLPVTNVLGCAFNAVNFVMFSHTFPSAREQVLWKAGTFATTTFSGLAVILHTIMLGSQEFFFRVDAQTRRQRIVKILVIIGTAVTVAFWIIGYAAYLAGRVALIVDAFFCLRSLPESALETPPWTRYIPHLS